MRKFFLAVLAVVGLMSGAANKAMAVDYWDAVDAMAMAADIGSADALKRDQAAAQIALNSDDYDYVVALYVSVGGSLPQEVWDAVTQSLLAASTKMSSSETWYSAAVTQDGNGIYWYAQALAHFNGMPPDYENCVSKAGTAGGYFSSSLTYATDSYDIASEASGNIWDAYYLLTS